MEDLRKFVKIGKLCWVSVLPSTALQHNPPCAVLPARASLGCAGSTACTCSTPSCHSFSQSFELEHNLFSSIKFDHTTSPTQLVSLNLVCFVAQLLGICYICYTDVGDCLYSDIHVISIHSILGTVIVDCRCRSISIVESSVECCQIILQTTVCG